MSGEVQTRCWCWSCLVANDPSPLALMNRPMILCPDCGNKRCPRATSHELACTNSNEPGQSGSVYE